MIRRRLGSLRMLYLTVETILSPNLAKSVVDGGRLATTSTICSPPVIVPQEGLSREMKPSPRSPDAVFETKSCIAGWTTIGLVVCGGLGSNLEAFRRKTFADIFASKVLVEGAEPLEATEPKVVSAETVHHGNQQWQGCRVLAKHTLKLVLWRSHSIQNGTRPCCMNISGLPLRPTGGDPKAGF